jgi:enoyl-CoA hydratase
MKKMNIGQKASVSKVFYPEEVKSFALSSEDSNPVHLDQVYASKTIFKRPIVHGMLAASLFGGLLGSELPGTGTIYLGQTLKFLKPNFVGDKIKAEIEIINIREDKPIYTFATRCYNSNGEITIDGEAVVMYKGETFN